MSSYLVHYILYLEVSSSLMAASGLRLEKAYRELIWSLSVYSLPHDQAVSLDGDISWLDTSKLLTEWLHPIKQSIWHKNPLKTIRFASTFLHVPSRPKSFLVKTWFIFLVLSWAKGVEHTGRAHASWQRGRGFKSHWVLFLLFSILSVVRP